MRNTPEHQAAMEKAVNRRLREGWDWTPFCDDIQCLMPPEGDKRRMWAAEWIPYIGKKVIPHWAMHEAEPFYEAKNK